MLFKRHLTKCKDKSNDKWFEITPDIIARVAAVQDGYVNIRHCNFNPNDNYSKHLNDNKYQHREELIKCLKENGYEMENEATSLGRKTFKKYIAEDKGPQYIVLSILEEFAKLKDEFETIFGRT